jgi:hypothetical protein
VNGFGKDERVNEGRLSQSELVQSPSARLAIFLNAKNFSVTMKRPDLRSVDLVDTHTQQIVCPLYPLDKSANAHGLRRRLDPPAEPTPLTPASGSGVAPLTREN